MTGRSLGLLAACIALLAGCGGDGGGKDAEPRLIAAVGDSITAGAPGWDPEPSRRALLDAHDPESQWEHWAALELGDGYEFRNCGVPGDRTDEIAARLEACMEGADVVVLQGGVNDLAQGRTPAYAERNLRAMVQRVREAGLPLLIANLLPVNRNFRGIRPAIRELNRRIDAIARQQGIDVVDFFGTLDTPTPDDRLRPAWTADGVHPSVEGYRRLGRLVAEACSTGGQCDPVQG
jgi:lysophospholipase L1-like esterase